MLLTRRNTLAALGGLAVASAAGPVFADTYPGKSVRYVVPFPPGGATDILARLTAQKLSEQYGQQVVVDNRPGAGGNIGADIVAKAPPDGYTILMCTVGTHAINASLYKTMPYDTVKDFTPVVNIAAVPNVMVVHPSVKATTVQEFIALAKASPGKINFASSGNGTSIHLAGELFKTMAGLNMVHVPYRGSAPAVTDLLAGQVQVMFDNLPSALPHVKAGTLRAIAVTSLKPSRHMPGLPSISESGLAGFDATAWFGILGPAGLPRDITDKLNRDVNAILKTPEMQQKLDENGAEAIGGSPEDFSRHIGAELAKWQKVVQASGARVD